MNDIQWAVLGGCLLFLGGLDAMGATTQWARGSVFEDRNRNQIRDDGEPGLAGVRVSNGRQIVGTDQAGRWRLPIRSGDIIFVIKPRNWMTPVSRDQLPRFYYIHKPEGSPPSAYPGVAPTGPLPRQIDFPLYPQTEPDRFQVIFFGDPQPRNQQEIDYIAHDVVEELIGTEARFGVTLGDILFDDLSLFGSFNATVGMIGIPWYNVIGNHDLNLDSENDGDSDETFHRFFGPNFYAFDYGRVHFIVLDNVDWQGPEHSYRGALDAAQLQFVANDLKEVPEDQLIVLSMHIPLTNMVNRHELYRLLEDRPFSVSLSGHTHWQGHQFIRSSDGWMGSEPHHHIVNVTVSGTWWRGFQDEVGIPHATMRDGAPNGYSILTFDGNRYSFEFKAARRPADYQMNIYAPEMFSSRNADSVDLQVNVFAGSEKSQVRFRIVGATDWISMTPILGPDPEYVRTRNRELEAAPEAPALNSPVDSLHLWRAQFPPGLPVGTHRIEVVTVDAFGTKYSASRIVRVTE